MGSNLAAAAPSRCVDSKTFYAKGGKLIKTVQYRYGGVDDELPYFSCDRPSCIGSVLFRGTIDQNGIPRDLRVISNTWNDRPKEHAAVIMRRVAATRYHPPQLAGKLVCIRDWQIEINYK